MKYLKKSLVLLAVMAVFVSLALGYTRKPVYADAYTNYLNADTYGADAVKGSAMPEWNELPTVTINDSNPYVKLNTENTPGYHSGFWCFYRNAYPTYSRTLCPRYVVSDYTSGKENEEQWCLTKDYNASRLLFAVKIRVEAGTTLSIIGASEDGGVSEDGRLNGGSDVDSSLGKMYWVVMEMDEDGYFIYDGDWRPSTDKWTVGEEQNLIEGHDKSYLGEWSAVEDKAAARYKNVRYVMVVIRINSGDITQGGTSPNITRKSLAETFPNLYVVGGEFNYEFHANGGTAYDSNGNDLGSDTTVSRFGIAPPTEGGMPDAKRPGYVFYGWKIAESGDEDKYSSVVVVNDGKQNGVMCYRDGTFRVGGINGTWYPGPQNGTNILTDGKYYSSLFSSNKTTHFIAQWLPEDYAITYNLNGGTVSGNPATYNIETNTFTLKNPTKSGYKFIGWTGSNGSTPQTTVTIPKGSMGNKTYTANWALMDYTITYDLQGGTVSGNPTSYTVDTPTFTLNNPTRNGYKFIGWTGSNGSTPQTTVTITQGSTGNRTYTANWEAESYTITYDLQGGTVSGNPTSYTVETPTFTLKNPTRNGYKFLGWTGSNGSTPQTTVTIAKGSTGNRTYTANWERVNVKVTVQHFVMNTDGSYPSTPTKTTSLNMNVGERYADYGSTYFKDASLEQANVITLSGYRYPDSGAVEEDTSINVVKLYYARKAYTITFNVAENLGWWDAECIDKEDKQEVFYYGQTINLSAYTATKGLSNWSFIGWNTDKDAKSGLSSVTVTSNMVLYAQFKGTIKIGFIDAQGRREYPLDMYNREYIASMTVPYIRNYTAWSDVNSVLAWGWTRGTDVSTAEGITTAVSEGAAVTLDKTENFYAVYKGFAIVKYDVNGGNPTHDTEDDIVTIYKNSSDLSKIRPGSITLPSCTRNEVNNGDGTMTVYTFAGWTVTGSDLYSAGGIMQITGNTTLKVVWDVTTREIEYSIVFEMNGGSDGPTPIHNIKYNQEVVLLDQGRKTGFDLKGWSTTPDGSGGVTYLVNTTVKNLTTEDGATVKLYAQWGKKKFFLKKISSTMYNATLIRRTEGDDEWFNTVGKITIQDWRNMTEQERLDISQYVYKIDKDGNITRIK